MELFRGIPRKIAIGTILLIILGWFLVIVGFGIATVQDSYPRTGSQGTYPFWAVIIGGPFAIAAALIHAAYIHKMINAVVGCVKAALEVFFVAALGMSLYFTGVFIHDFDVSENSFNLIFAGSFIAILFWTITMMLSAFYDIDVGRDDHDKI